jgi:hypothetical protein
MVARSVMCVRATGRVDSPDDRTNPGDGGKDQIADGSKHEDVERAVVFPEQSEFETEQTVGESEEAPGEHAGDKQFVGQTVEANQRDASEQSKKRRGDNVAFQGNGLKRGHTVRDEEPAGEDQGQRNASV